MIRRGIMVEPRGDRAGLRLAASALALLALLLATPEASAGEATSAAGDAEIRAIDPPAAAGAFAPRLVAGDGELLATWWERVAAAEGTRRHRLLFARRTGTWSSPSVVVEAEDLFANWADFPTVIREPAGSLLAHWLAKTSADTYAYSIELARSSDDGRSWQRIGRLNDDDTDTEHGFVSLVVEGDAVRAFWLDGRAMAAGGPMGLRTALVGETVGPSELLDPRVCECCPTAAVATPGGAVIVYRDRADDETRDIYALRGRAGSWEGPEPVARDDWRIPGCPVNGPSIAHRDGRTAVAWFTAKEGAPRVAVAFGVAGGVPMVVDDGKPLGRVGVALDADGSAIVSWLAVVGDEAEVRLRRVADGAAGRVLALGRTSHARSSGVPQLVRRGDTLFVGWVEDLGDGPSRLRVREVPVARVPGLEGPPG